MLRLSEIIILCQGSEQQWSDCKARCSFRNLTYGRAITIYGLPMKTNTKQQSRHTMGRTSLMSCTLGCAMHLHSSKEQCKKTLHLSLNSIGRTWTKYMDDW